MSEASTQQSPEDLSKLKGPSRWWWVIMLMAAVAIVGVLRYCGWRGVWPLWAQVLLVISMASFVVDFGLWIVCNRVGHTIRWWKDGDTWRMTAREYPTAAEGLVIEVRVKARPSFKLRWRSKGWCHLLIDGDGWVVNLKGERLRLVQDSQTALNSEGLDVVVVDFLYNASQRWNIIPLDAGRTLRFVDRCGMGIEVFFNGVTGVDLQEILRSQDCADYHKRMQEKARFYDEAYRLIYEALKALRLSSPIHDETLVERIRQIQAAALDQCALLEVARAQLCVVLVILRDDAAKHAGRPKSKLAYLQRVRALLNYLHTNLPSDSPLREKYNISQAELDRVDSEIAALTAQLAPAGAPRPGGVGDEV